MKFTTDQKSIIAKTTMKGAPPEAVDAFVATCERTGLDPFARQIMATSRNVRKNDGWETQWNYIVTIDGLRSVAIASSDYEGMEGPYWCGKDGKWQDIWLEDKPPFASKVIIHRKGFSHPVTAIAKYESYLQKTKDGRPNQVWNSLGDHMIAKVAEALGLRKAFPLLFGGLYTVEEMAQSGQVPEPAIKEALDKTAEETGRTIRPGDSNPPEDAPTTETNVNGEEVHVWTIDEKDQLDQMVTELTDVIFHAGHPYLEAKTRARQYWEQMETGESFDKVMDRVSNAYKRYTNDAKPHYINVQFVSDILDTKGSSTLIEYASKIGRTIPERPHMLKNVEPGFLAKSLETLRNPEKGDQFIQFMEDKINVRQDQPFENPEDVQDPV